MDDPAGAGVFSRPKDDAAGAGVFSRPKGDPEGAGAFRPLNRGSNKKGLQPRVVAVVLGRYTKAT